MPLSISLPLVPFLIAMNAFFVAAEYALVAIRESQIEGMRLSGRRRAASAMARLKSDPASAIGAIQVCITMTNLLLGWIGEPAMGRLLAMLFAPLLDYVPPTLFQVIALGLSFIIVTLMTVVFSELLPKALTLRYVPAVAALTAVPVSGVLAVTRPLVWLMNWMANLVTKPLGLGSVDDMEKDWHTAEEIKIITAEAAQQGALTARQGSLILNTLSFGTRTARHIMVPRVRVAALDLDKTAEQNRQVLQKRLYSRFPLCQRSLDKVIGVVHTKDLLFARGRQGEAPDLKSVARPPAFVPDTLPLDRLLPSFAERGTEMLFIVDEYGGVEGIVSIRDVVDELAGEMRGIEAGSSGADTPPSRATVTEVRGDMPLWELAQQVDERELAAVDGPVTVGGFMMTQLGRVPAAGEEVAVGRLRLLALATDARSVHRVAVLANPRPGRGGDATGEPSADVQSQG